MSDNPNSRLVSEEQQPARRFVSISFTLLTVAASVVTLMPLFSQATPIVSSLPPSPVPSLSPPMVAFAQPVRNARACVLERTEVTSKVLGYTSRVTVKQVFRNPNSEKFDAVYSFPLSDSAAVDQMTMKIGHRVIEGQIKKKAEAKAIYQAAQAQGKTAALLEQQRTNVFTQSIANVEPGQTIEVTLQYTDTLAFDQGRYSLVFPTRVGPRFTPDNGAESPVASGSSVYEGDISFDLDVDAGMPMRNIKSSIHPSQEQVLSSSTAHLGLSSVRPGDDVIVSWEVSTNAIESGVVAQRSGVDGYLTAMLMPPQHVTAQNTAPKELIFLIDCSGSQAGAPLQKAKETLHYIVEHMNADDTFQIVAFNNGQDLFSNEPVGVSSDMKRRAHEWIERLEASGGTMMAPAVERVCALPAANNRLRIVSFMTDGYVSNDYEVIGLVKKLRGKSRWFPFGTGNSVNRTLIDGIAKEGGGEAEYVALNRDGKDIAREFYDRISSPVLTDVKIRFEGVNVTDVYPKNLSDVWARKPLYYHARFHGFGSGTAVITGFAAGKPYEARLPISLPAFNTNNHAVAQTWARAKIDDLMSADLIGAGRGNMDSKVENEITDLAVKHHLMSQFTSFVAVDDKEKTGSYVDPNAPQVVSNQETTTATTFCSVANNATSYAAPSRSTSWNPLERALQDSLDATVSQLNCLNAYSASGTSASANFAPALSPPALPYAPTAEPSSPAASLVQYVGLVIMWAASLYLLFRRKRKVVNEEV